MGLLFRKISYQKEGLQQLHDQKDLLLREIHHRVKNNLQMVSSLLSLQTQFIEDPAAWDAIEMGRQRVRSLAILHQRMYLRDHMTPAVNARSYLDQLIRELLQTLNVGGINLQLQKRLEDIDLDIDRLIPLGLIANEVITNAIKHAFTLRNAATLTVELLRDADDIELRIADDGRGIRPEEISGKESFGSLLIHTFAEQLDGRLSIVGGRRWCCGFRYKYRPNRRLMPVGRQFGNALGQDEAWADGQIFIIISCERCRTQERP
ncbi:two-component sensor histidine kinase [Neolewinella xylanilytica]|uniref:histidine kinase n=1 Tax=Neolewinella xylanilytica TaxID=1514080 RepID=A0A2S6I9H9_9BACT|nr:sensor histidine kinase [Neolewinella xylanilytica]PPK88156.1 two-component sensor histidine kinase [Neolewinella xylanilytica]